MLQPAANWPGMCKQRGNKDPGLERRNTNLWSAEGLNHCFTDLKNWLVPKEVELPLVALPAAGGWTETQPQSALSLGLSLPISRLHQHHGDHSSDLCGTELWILLRKGPCLQIHFLLLSIHSFFTNKIQGKTPSINVLFHGLSGRHWDLMGKASGWKWGCAKSFQVLGWEPVRNGFYESHFPLSTWPEACHSRKSCFLLQRAWGWHSQPRGVIYRALTAGLTPWKTNTIYLSTTPHNKRGSKKQDELWKQNWWFYLFYDHSGGNPPEKQTLSKGKRWTCRVKQCSKHGKSPFTWMRQETRAETLQTPKDTNGLSTDQI